MDPDDSGGKQTCWTGDGIKLQKWSKVEVRGSAYALQTSRLKI